MYQVSEIIYSILNSNSALMAIANKISPIVAYQDTSYPFVNYTVSEQGQLSKTGSYPYTITIACFAESYNQSLQLAEAVKTAFKESEYNFKYDGSIPSYSADGVIYTESTYQFKL